MFNYFEIKNVTFQANENKTISDVNLNIKRKGEIICLLGPSGIGKTTILRSIAGLKKIIKGEILLNDKLISSKNFTLEPEKRNIALSFQENSLFPHKNVIENISLGLESNQIDSGNKTLNELIEIFQLNNLLDKYPHEISAGEAQRVSIVRSLVTIPKLLLLDEPLANIDQILRDDLQVKVKRFLKDRKITTIIVTHDSYEAFYLADKCGLIIDGTLKQYDTPYNIYHYPKSLEVVNFLKRGILINVKVMSKNKLYNESLGEISGNLLKKLKIGANVKLLIQPDDLEHDDGSKLKLDIVDRKFRGTDFIYTLKTKNDELIPVFVHSHHEHQHKIRQKFGIKTPININHLVCFKKED